MNNFRAALKNDGYVSADRLCYIVHGLSVHKSVRPSIRWAAAAVVVVVCAFFPTTMPTCGEGQNHRRSIRSFCSFASRLIVFVLLFLLVSIIAVTVITTTTIIACR